MLSRNERLVRTQFDGGIGMKHAAALGCLFFLNGCMSGPVVIEDDSRESIEKPIPPGQAVLVLAPVVTYELIHDGSHMEPPKDGESTIDRPLDSAIQEELSDRGFRLSRKAAPRESEAGGATGTAAAARLLELSLGKAGDDRSKAMDLLRSLKASSGAQLVAVASAKVKVGDGGGYEPFFSAVWYDTSRTDFRFSLLSLDTGEPAWTREVLLRGRPTAGSASRCAGLAFSELKEAKGE